MQMLHYHIKPYGAIEIRQTWLKKYIYLSITILSCLPDQFLHILKLLAALLYSSAASSSLVVVLKMLTKKHVNQV